MTSKEKAEERYGNMPFGIGVERRSIFIAGAKWQEDNSDKKYTEEDVIDLFKKFGVENRNIPEDKDSWIELKSEHIEEWIHNKLNKQDNEN